MIEDPELARLFRAESEEHLARLDEGLLHLEKSPSDAAVIEELFRESHSMKGASRMLGLAAIESAAHELETTLNSARKGESSLTGESVDRMNGLLSKMRLLVESALGGKAPAAFPAPPAERIEAPDAFRIETVRVETKKLDDLLSLVGELSVIQGRMQHRISLLDSLAEDWAGIERRRTRSGTAQAESMSRIGRKIASLRDAFFEDGTRLESTFSALEERVHSARLLPLSTVFSLFPRMVRDLAASEGKEASLSVEGAEITVDKRILEEMKDPLMHLLRNAVDHGIENPEQRRAKGKPAEGRISLRANRVNGSILIEVQDDGKGLDLAAIGSVALKRGLVDEAGIQSLSESQIEQLLFLPGFSTSGFVTEISGRGIGLDVVRNNVEKLKGEIRMNSLPGAGVSIRMRLPLSLATTRLLLARIGERLYGIPIESVYTSVRVGREEWFGLEGKPAINLEGEPVIAARLAELISVDSPSPEKMACIVIQVGEERLGLLVDDLVTEEEVVPKPLGAPLVRVRNVSALAMLGSGEICAVLNPADLVRSTRRKSAPVAKTKPPVKSAVEPILLVEDSALVRAMEIRILEEAGFQVTAAVDGMDALEKLSHAKFSAVVSDILMPNLDGLSLTRKIRAEPAYRDLPVILVTSLATDEDKRRGLEVGANAYIPKPSFDQRLLLDTLRRLI